MIYLAELLVVMTDWLKIVRILARNVPRVHGHKRLDDDAFLAPSVVPGKRRCRVMMCRGAILLKDNNCLRTTCACLAVASEQEVVATVCSLHFDIKSEQPDCNKSSVR